MARHVVTVGGIPECDVIPERSDGPQMRRLGKVDWLRVLVLVVVPVLFWWLVAWLVGRVMTGH